MDDQAPPQRTARRPDRPPSRAERRADAARMVELLARALACQLARLAADGGTAPVGWWFTPDTRDETPDDPGPEAGRDAAR